MADRKLADQQETYLASVLPGASRTSSSGSRRESHDVRTLVSETNNWWRWRYEAKCTQKKSMSFKLADWRDLERDVYSSSVEERPAWAIRFYDEDASVLKDLVAVDLNDWMELLVELERLRGSNQKEEPVP